MIKKIEYMHARSAEANGGASDSGKIDLQYRISEAV